VCVDNVNINNEEFYEEKHNESLRRRAAAGNERPRLRAKLWHFGIERKLTCRTIGIRDRNIRFGTFQQFGCVGHGARLAVQRNRFKHRRQCV
jgi:hypothetical protein